MQHFIKILKAGGKAGIVIKNTFLSNTDNASVAIRKELLENCTPDFSHLEEIPQVPKTVEELDEEITGVVGAMLRKQKTLQL